MAAEATKPTHYFNAGPDRAYYCDCPKDYGPEINRVCIHGWNTAHCVSEHDAQLFDHLVNCGVIVGERQQIEKIHHDDLPPKVSKIK